MKSLIVCYSYHHMNTLKVAKAMGEVLECEVVTPEEVEDTYFENFDLIGFGAGIDSAKHYPKFIEFANELNEVNEKKCFIFSTSAVMGDKKIYKDHTALRDILLSKGYVVLDEFACKGFNTNSFLKFFGGMNKQSPTPDDLQHARAFVEGLKKE